MVIKATNKKKSVSVEPQCTVGCQGTRSIYTAKNKSKINDKKNANVNTNIDVYDYHASKFVIFSIEGCNYCAKAKKLLADMKLKHHIVDVPANKKNFYKTAHSMKTFPQIFYHTRDNLIIKIGGCDELETILKILTDLL